MSRLRIISSERRRDRLVKGKRMKVRKGDAR